jgi:methionyl-tRNA formyltransferase
MGSPEFALESLRVVHQHTSLQAVFTQPDKPRARGNKMLPTPVKSLAQELGYPVFEPAKIRDPQVLEQIQELAPDVILVVAYAKLIPKSLLDLPRFGCINVHPSLLPRYRGAIPIQAALLNGDTETGVCTFFMDEGYDTGDLILKRSTPILEKETGEQLGKRLASFGAEVLRDTILSLEDGSFQRTPQPAEAEGGYTKPLQKGDLVIAWQQPASKVANFIRALAHDIGAQTNLAENLLKVGRATAQIDVSGPPGEILAAVKGQGFLVGCGEGAVLIQEVKPAGKGWMPAWSYWQGGALRVGQVLGN